MKSASILALLCLTPSCLDTGSGVNLHGGLSQLTEDYGNLDERPVVGLEGILGVGDGWGVEGAAFYAEEEEGPVELKTQELSAGLRKTFLEDLPVNLYLGAGPSWMQGELTGVPDEDGFGAYGHGGVELALLGFVVGLDLRYAYSGAKFGSERLTYQQATIFLGLSF